MLPLSAGTLRQHVQIQTKREEQDDTGGVVETWYTEAYRWACVEPLRGKELLEAQSVDSRITHKVLMRPYAPLTASYRLLHRGRALNVIAVLNVEERTIAYEVLAMEDA